MISRDGNFNEDGFGQKVIQEETKNTPVLELLFETTDEIAKTIPDEQLSETSKNNVISSHDNLDSDVSDSQESNASVR